MVALLATQIHERVEEGDLLDENDALAAPLALGTLDVAQKTLQPRGLLRLAALGVSRVPISGGAIDCQEWW